jgi:quinoprotein glucose dehydrogenase
MWDYDPTASPKLVTVRHNGRMVEVVAQAGKTGFLYVLDRVTGEPIWPIEERPVPKSTVPGARIRELVTNGENHGVFTPASLDRDSIEIPGDDGGANWSNTAADAQAGMVYVRSGDGPNQKRMRAERGGRGGGGPRARSLVGGTPEEQGNALFMQQCQGSAQAPGRAPGEGVTWKAGKPEAQGYHAFALPK